MTTAGDAPSATSRLAGSRLAGFRLAPTQAGIARRLAEAGIASARLDARLLVMAATGLSLEALIAAPERPLADVERRRLEQLSRRRLAREPLSRILGEREFYGRPFAIGPASLDPRPDTETLVDHALGVAARRQGPAPAILDLGTGSGAILVTLLAELPHSHGTGSDVSDAALADARTNAQRHGVAARASFLAAEWCDGIPGRFDMIVSNPPYIPAGDLADLAPEVRDYDPRRALDGGPDGLAAYRAIAAGAGRLLAPGGHLAVEIGAGQGPDIAAVFTAHGWQPAGAASTRHDLAGHVRVLGFDRRGSLPCPQKRVGIRAATR